MQNSSLEVNLESFENFLCQNYVQCVVSLNARKTIFQNQIDPETIEGKIHKGGWPVRMERVALI